MVWSQSLNSSRGSRCSNPDSISPSMLLSFPTTVHVQHPKREEPVPQEGADDLSTTRGHSPPSAFLYNVTKSRWVPPHGAGRCRRTCHTSSVVSATIGLKTKHPAKSAC